MHAVARLPFLHENILIDRLRFTVPRDTVNLSKTIHKLLVFIRKQVE